ncbi:MAG: hypothetical protein Q8926_12275 [Bacteroidota bacterium]|nr:hypothetical protein [Bacteroidota bacterium]
MEGFTLYFGLLSVVSFMDVLLFLMLLLKIFSWHLHGLIVLVCAVLISSVFFDIDFWPFRTVSNAIILFVVLLGLYLIAMVIKNK